MVTSPETILEIALPVLQWFQQGFTRFLAFFALRLMPFLRLLSHFRANNRDDTGILICVHQAEEGLALTIKAPCKITLVVSSSLNVSLPSDITICLQR